MTNSEARLAVLEQRMSAIEQTQKESMMRLEKAMTRLTDRVEELTAVMNKGKGAFAASMAIAGMIGAAIMAIINKIIALGHH